MLVDRDRDVAVRANPLADVPAPLRDRVIRRAPRGAQQIARLDRHLADVVCDVSGIRVIAVARFDGLIDINVVRDMAPKQVFRAKTALAHDPRYERCRPWIVPARPAAVRPVPDGVLPVEDPRAIVRNGPIACDRVRYARRFP